MAESRIMMSGPFVKDRLGRHARKSRPSGRLVYASVVVSARSYSGRLKAAHQ
ncbi:hypothetical protein LX88_001895 [Lentzea californiensis]|nr:hypothetical protein [Lentzea californiensis]